MRRVVLAFVLVVTACSGSSAPTAQSSPSAIVTPSPTTLNGDLPVWVGLGSGDNPALANAQVAGGFVHFPGGLFRRDPHADMLTDSSIPNVVRTKTPDQPYLYAGEGSPVQSVQITYDRVVDRWLPVNRTQVSADGLHYAYIDYESGSATPQRLHIVDVRSASDQMVYRAPAHPCSLFSASLIRTSTWPTASPPRFQETAGGRFGAWTPPPAASPRSATAVALG